MQHRFALLSIVVGVVAACAPFHTADLERRGAVPRAQVKLFLYRDQRDSAALPIGLDVEVSGYTGYGEWPIYANGYTKVARFFWTKRGVAAERVADELTVAAAEAGADTLLIVFKSGGATGYAYAKAPELPRPSADALFAQLTSCKEAGFEKLGSYATRLENIESPAFEVARGDCLCFEWALDEPAAWSGIALQHAAESIGDPPGWFAGSPFMRGTELRAHAIPLRCSTAPRSTAFGFGVNASGLPRTTRLGKGALHVRVFRKRISEAQIAAQEEAARARGQEIDDAVRQDGERANAACARCSTLVSLCAAEASGPTQSVSGVTYSSTRVDPLRCRPYLDCLQRAGVSSGSCD